MLPKLSRTSRRFFVTAHTSQAFRTIHTAGLLTYSGNRCLLNRHNQWLSVFSGPFCGAYSSGLGTDGIVFGGKRLGLYYLECGAAFRNSNVVYDREGSSFATLRPGMIDWETIFADAGWFHWSGIAAALSQEGADACREALEIADRMGLTISCDLNFRKKLWNYGCTAAEVMQPLVQYSDVIFGAEPEYQEILGIQPVGFRAVDTADVSFESDLPSFEKFGQEVERLVPRCQKVFLELRNSITSNHNVLAAVLYSDGTLKHTGIYDIEHETDRVGRSEERRVGKECRSRWSPYH